MSGRSPLLLAALWLGCRTSTPPTPIASPQSPRVPESAVVAAAPAEPWTINLGAAGLDAHHVSTAEDGSVLVAGTFEASLTLPDQPSVVPRGPRDVAVVTISPSGHVHEVQTLAASTAEVTALERHLLSVVTQHAVSIGKTHVQAPAPRGVFPGARGVVVDTRAAAVLYQVDDLHDLHAWPLPDGSVLVAAFFDDGATPPHTQLVRIVDQRAVWTTELPGVEVSAATEADGTVWVATRGDRRLDVVPLDTATGAAASPTVTVRPGFDDLGSIVALDGDRAWGHTSGPVHDGMSHAARPFRADATRFQPLRDATAFVLDADPSSGDVLVSVLFESDDTPPLQPGTYLLRDEGAQHVDAAQASHGRLTDAHAVLLRACGRGTCVEAIPR